MSHPFNSSFLNDTMCESSPFPSEQMQLKASTADLSFMADNWPAHYGTLYDMGLTAFGRIFELNPKLTEYFNFGKSEESWKDNDTIKKMVLSLQQLLTDAVNMLGYEGTIDSREEFARTLRELGGLHKKIANHVHPDAFTLLFAILPEVIVDVTSNRRKQGPLPYEDRTRLLFVWRLVTRFMANHVMTGWERNRIPTQSKYLKIYMEKCPHAKPEAQIPVTPPGGIPEDYRLSRDDRATSSSLSLRHVALSPLSALRK